MAEVSEYSISGHSKSKDKSDNSSAPDYGALNSRVSNSRVSNSRAPDLLQGSASNIEFHSASGMHIITYGGEYKSDFFLKRLAPSLVSNFGEERISAASELFSYMFPPLLVMFSFLFSGFLSSNLGVPLWVDTFIVVFGIALGVLAVVLGEQFSRIADYHRDARCRACCEPFACEEFEIPDVKELSTPHSYSVKITRYWKCKNCGHEEARTGSEGIVTFKGNPGVFTPQKMSCRVCGKNAACEEFKRPDVKEIKQKFWALITTTRYYRCKHCGQEDIKVEKQRI
ncbi:hypothetical protein ACSAZK_09400 [Methanosarcina sp. Mfa9]|uniref:hypothetical protein n=1 Tax=Methanosarcina sp. Mfa9 TaxID=3439063 RepID=UPI003F85038E